VKSVTSNQRESTREIILRTIKQSPQCSVEELAEAVEISPVTVRHHLNGLQAEGLIENESVRRKVGRPYFVYSISDKGQELFPKRYVRLTSRLFDELKNRLPVEMVRDIMLGVVQGVIADHQGEFEHLPLEARLTYLMELLAEEGFLADWQKDENGYTIIEYSCPYLSVGQKHMEVCTFDKELMVQVIQAPVTQHSCMLEGADCCEFSIAA
jgi:DeoR family transcriptional regulator, suf operon transcriptional repressor